MKKVILSDVDGTITRGSLVLDHASMLHEKGLINLGELPTQWQADKKNENLITALAEEYRNQIVGLTREELLIEDFITAVLHEGNFYETLQRLQDATNEGHDVVLISGSPEYLVAEFASRFGFAAVGSSYFFCSEGKITGEVNGMFNADAKRSAISSMRVRETYTEVHAYGDTLSDEPLFDVADYSVLVQPTDETFAAVGHKIHELID